MCGTSEDGGLGERVERERGRDGGESERARRGRERERERIGREGGREG